MVNINKLNGGNITITTGGSSDSTLTRYKLVGDTEWRTMAINGIISGLRPDQTGGSPEPSEFFAYGNIEEIEFGSTVTGVINYAFAYNSGLKKVTIPLTLEQLNSEAFSTTRSESVEFTFVGRTLSQAIQLSQFVDQGEPYGYPYPWEITEVIFHCSDGSYKYEDGHFNRINS